jgi:6-phosphofructo-2-kinase/fructose-2,6-biphosphatase 1
LLTLIFNQFLPTPKVSALNGLSNNVIETINAIQVNHIYGRMSKDLVPALMAWHIGSRPIFLIRPGRTVSGQQSDQSIDLSNNSTDASVGNSLFRRFHSANSISSKRRRGDALCPEGIAFRRSLWKFLYSEVKDFIIKRRSVADNKSTGTSISGLVDLPKYNNGDAVEELEENLENGMLPIRVLTSTMPRAVQTIAFDEQDVPYSQMSNLNPIDKGDFAGLELDEIRTEDPVFFHHLQGDTFKTRFPGGESYFDLVRRLKPVVIDVEQQVVPVVVVSHVSILQCLMAYFRNTSVQSCMTAEVPMHTVIKFEPARGGGWQESWHPLECKPSSEDGGMVAVPSISEFSAITMDPEQSTHGENPIWEAEGGPTRRTSFNQLRKQMTT